MLETTIFNPIEVQFD